MQHLRPGCRSAGRKHNQESCQSARYVRIYAIPVIGSYQTVLLLRAQCYARCSQGTPCGQVGSGKGRKEFANNWRGTSEAKKKASSEESVGHRYGQMVPGSQARVAANPLPDGGASACLRSQLP